MATSSNLRSIAWFLLITGTALFGCISYWLSLQSTQSIELEEERHRLELRAKQLNEAVAQQMDATMRSVDTALQHLRTVYINDRKNFDKTARDVLAAYPKGMLQFITVFGSDGYLAYSSNNTSERIFFGDREHFRVHTADEKDELFVSKPITGRIANVQLIQITRVIRDGKRFLGVIGIPLRPDYLSMHLKALRVDSTDMIAIARLDGTLIARSSHLDEALKAKLPADRPFIGAQVGQRGLFRSQSKIDGIPLLFSWQRISAWPLCAVAAISEETALGPVIARHTLQRRNAFSAMTMVLVFTIIVAFLVIRTKRANIQLVESATRLQEQKAQLTTVMTNTPDTILQVTRDGKIIFANQLVPNLTKEQVIGSSIYAWVPNAQHPILESALKAVFSNKERQEFVTQGPGPSGELREYGVRAMPVIIYGRAETAIFTATDITERNKIERALQESERRYRSFAEELPLGIVITQEGLVKYTNPATARMIGYPVDEIVGKPFLNFVAEKDHAFILDLHKRWMAGDAVPSSYELSMVCKDGEVRQWHFSTQTLMLEGKLSGLATIVDITEQKRTEEARLRLEAQLRESQKMEALGTMAGGVAHDFNNALAMIIGNAELARQDVGPDHPALVSLDEISKASRRAKDLVQQILSFGRRQQLDRKATSLALVVVETARLVRATLPAMVSLSVNCEPDAPAVLADATQIKQILLNLCSNAIQAIQDHGSPGKVEINLGARVQTEAAASPNLKAGRYACLTVRDTGPGMNETTRSHIFEPFFTTKPVGKGTGLGLAVVHGIAQAHGATVDVESAPGKGSAFRIYFPAIDAQGEEIAQSEPGAVQVDGAGKRVLYVDDEEAIIFLMQRLLERQGFRVSGFTDPRAALAAVQANPGDFDLAVTDFNMPGMSGLEVASALREIRPDLPVVLASGYITEDLRQKAPAAGVRELIYKPNTVDDLCAAVARYANARSGEKSSP